MNHGWISAEFFLPSLRHRHRLCANIQSLVPIRMEAKAVLILAHFIRSLARLQIVLATLRLHDKKIFGGKSNCSFSINMTNLNHVKEIFMKFQRRNKFYYDD